MKTDEIWVLACAMLVMAMQIGFCMLEAGLVRSKNSINVAIKNLLDFCVASLLFWGAGYALMFGASAGGWIGTSGFFPGTNGGTAATVFLVFQMMFCATAATIVSGAVAERMSFASYIGVTAVISGVVYPVAGGWAWNEAGWLRELGFRDFAGATVVHSVGGWVALAAVGILGARRGRFEGGTRALASSHSLVISTIGVVILFVGWLGFNGGSAGGFGPAVPGILLNTILAGAAGCIVALAAVWWHRKLPELPATLNGCVGGLVAVTAACNALGPGGAVVVGAVGGLLSYVAIFVLERLRLDDVVGASAAHGVTGVWGTLAVGFLGDLDVLGTGLGRGGQIGVQALGVAVFFAWAYGFGWILLSALNRLRPLRIDEDSERIGLNVSEHGASTEIIDLLHEMENHRSRGEFDRRIVFEPFTEVGQIASEYNRVIDKVVMEMEAREAIARRLEDARNESENANRRIFGSLEYARRIQRSILPERRELTACVGEHFVVYRPREIVSGDFYWCRRLGDTRFLAVVDCTGHGVPGAFMSMIGHLLLEHIVTEDGLREPAEILSALHRRVRSALGQDSTDGAENRDGMEIALVRIQGDALDFAGAHRSLWWYREHAGNVRSGVVEGDHNGIGGGRHEPVEIRFSQKRLPLVPGLTIYLQSDGIVQQPNHLRHPFGAARLQSLLADSYHLGMFAQKTRVEKAFDDFCGGANPRDDVTLLGFRVCGLVQAPTGEPGSDPDSDEPAEKNEWPILCDTPLTQRTIVACARRLRSALPGENGRHASAVSVFVEIAQNVLRHSAQRGTEAGSTFAAGTVRVFREGDGIVVRSENPVEPAEAERLVRTLAALSAMSQAELDQRYLDTLHQAGPGEQSRGLGLLEIARKSRRPLEFGTVPEADGDGFFLFFLEARLSG